MNFINFNNHFQRKTLSALGVNMYYVRKGKNKTSKHKNIVNVVDVIALISNIRNSIYAGRPEELATALDYICANKEFKKETLLKGIYCYRNNICERKLYNIIIEDYEKKETLIERLDLIIFSFRILLQPAP